MSDQPNVRIRLREQKRLESIAEVARDGADVISGGRQFCSSTPLEGQQPKLLGCNEAAERGSRFDIGTS